MQAMPRLLVRACLLGAWAVAAASVSACAGPDPSVLDVKACTLEAYQGSLSVRSGALAFTGGRWDWTEVKDVGLIWPKGWSTRTTPAGVIEVLRPDGAVAAKSGTAIAIYGLSVGGNETMRDGKFVTCDPPF